MLIFKSEMTIRLDQQTGPNVATLRQAEACAALNQPMDIFGRKWKIVRIDIAGDRTVEIGLLCIA